MSPLMRLLAIPLLPFIAVYTFLVYLRNKFYDWRLFKTCDIPLPIISIGNIQLGGTGKTPLVQHMADYLKKYGQQVVILSRGYRRSHKEPVLIDESNRESISVDLVGDEPYLMSRNLPSVKFAVDADRCRSAETVCSRWPDSVLILDDGFQHRRIKRSMDIVLIDACRWSGLPFLLPLTDFRDNKSSLKRADIFILNHSESCPERTYRLRKKLTTKYQRPIFNIRFKPLALQQLWDNTTVSLNHLKGLKIAAFCGIGHPISFFRMLQGLQVNLVWWKTYPDHHDYSVAEMQAILLETDQKQAELILTTQKDAVKIQSLQDVGDEGIFYLELGVELEHENEFFKLITTFLNKTKPVADPESK